MYSTVIKKEKNPKKVHIYILVENELTLVFILLTRK